VFDWADHDAGSIPSIWHPGLVYRRGKLLVDWVCCSQRPATGLTSLASLAGRTVLGAMRDVPEGFPFGLAPDWRMLRVLGSNPSGRADDG
jgi:hypothetical protein